mgnify:CR=1 FL=1
MLQQNFPHEHQAKALAVGLCGEERREETLFVIGQDTCSIVRYHNPCRRSCCLNNNLSVLADAFDGVLYDVQHNLFKEPMLRHVRRTLVARYCATYGSILTEQERVILIN